MSAVCRPADRTIALHPHCSRGRKAHWQNAVRWWAFATISFLALLFVLAYFASDGSQPYGAYRDGFIHYPIIGVAAFFALMIYSMARNLLPFASIAEEAFAALGFDDPTNVDLVKRTKASRKPVDPPALGSFYFRY